MSYYYLVASLPALQPGTAPPLSIARFREYCHEQLSRDDYAELCEALDATPARARGFARRWLEIDASVRASLAKLRAARARRPFDLRTDALLDRYAAEAFAHGNPAEREIAIDRVRWRILDELTFGEPFGLSSVIAWGLKLRMCERFAALDERAGREQLDATVDSIVSLAGRA
jgi:uncharacterized protein DUF2764